MSEMKPTAQTRGNTAGRFTAKKPAAAENHGIEDFSRDLKKVAKKQDRPSQRDSEKH
jgi:hypothetical protein